MHRHHGIDFASPQDCGFCILMDRITELTEQLKNAESERDRALRDLRGMVCDASDREEVKRTMARALEAREALK